MGNTSDFILKNAIEVGKDTKVTLGTITSGTVDLSTGNYFAETLAADTTYVFSNPGDVQSFQLEVTGGLGAFDTTSASPTGFSFTPTGGAGPIVIKPDGTKMYVLDWSAGPVYQYSLTTPWDLTTAVYDSRSFTIPTVTGAAYRGMDINSTGTKLFLLDHNSSITPRILEFPITTAWDIGSTSSSSVSFPLNEIVADGNAPYGMANSSDNLNFYVMSSSRVLYQYTLPGAAFQISNLSFTRKTSTLSSLQSFPREFVFKDSGTKIFVSGQSDRIDELSLSTAWDVSTISYVGSSASFVADLGDNNYYGFDVDIATKKAILACTTTDKLYEVDMATTSTLTWPASVQWPAGAAPITPAAGETDVYTFVTDDGGTTYIGLQTADNLS